MESGLASFVLSWGITVTAGLAAYPMDTVRRRMMLTSREAEKYSGSFHACYSILKKEGPKALYKGAFVNLLCALSTAGVIAIYENMELY